jgi:hypothetical protein
MTSGPGSNVTKFFKSSLMAWQDKLAVQPSLIFEAEASRLERLARDIHSSLSGPFVNGRESTINRSLDGSIYTG